MKSLLPLSLLFFVLLISCSTSDEEPAPPSAPIFIVNEGNFQAANGSISSYDVESGAVTIEVLDAGATIQNLRPGGDGYVLVTNAPDRMDVLNASFNPVLSVAEGLDNPIDVAVSGDRAYVTNWGDINTAFTDEPDSYIAVVDLSQGTVIDSILLDVRPQDITLAADQLFVTHESAAVMTVIDLGTLRATSIDTPFGPSEMVRDTEGDIWVLCTGGSLFKMDVASLEVAETLNDLTVNGFNEKMAIDNMRNIIYFLGGNNDSFTGLTEVYLVDLSETTLSAELIIGGGFAFYGLGVDETSGDIYVGDSNAFQSTGTGFRYESDGTLLHDFEVGIGPSQFLFAF